MAAVRDRPAVYSVWLRAWQVQVGRVRLYLLLKPFMGQTKGATKAEELSRLVEHADMKDAAAQLTQVSDDMLHNVFEASPLERLRIQHAAEGARELPMVQTR